MTTYVMRDGQLIEKDKAPPKSGVLRINHGVVSDIAPFQTQDGKHIGSRSDLRAYEHANGVRQVGNDYASDIARIRERSSNRL